MVNPVPPPADPRPGRRGRLGVVWVAGLLVALGAGVATAHGLYEVAVAAGTPKPLAWLYPLITDGLALVAYATTTRLGESGRRYAWIVVVVAAGLSGLTQASYLAGGVDQAPPALRFAIGAWPAIAAAIVAHLLYLLSTHHDPHTAREQTLAAVEPIPTVATATATTPPSVADTRPTPAALTHTSQGSGTASTLPPPQPPAVRQLNTSLNAGPPGGRLNVQPPEHPPGNHQPSAGRATAAPATDRALTLAREHAARHRRLPTVTELAISARVARGTAAAALKTLRQHPGTQPAGKPASNARNHP